MHHGSSRTTEGGRQITSGPRLTSHPEDSATIEREIVDEELQNDANAKDEMQTWMLLEVGLTATARIQLLYAVFVPMAQYFGFCDVLLWSSALQSMHSMLNSISFLPCCVKLQAALEMTCTVFIRLLHSKNASQIA